MRNFILIAFLFLTKFSLSQNGNVYGTYSSPYSVNGRGCFTINEVLTLNTNNTFSHYFQDEQCCYTIEGTTVGRFKAIGDSILFLTITPDSNASVKCLPSSENIGRGIIRLTFSKYHGAIEPFLNNKYYSIDDSFNVSNVSVIRTFPAVHELLDTMDNGVRLNYEKHQSLREFQVYLAMPEKHHLLFKSDSPFGFTAKIDKRFLATNYVYLDTEKADLVDASGYKFQIVNNSLGTLKPIGLRNGQDFYDVSFEKINFQNFDS